MNAKGSHESTQASMITSNRGVFSVTGGTITRHVRFDVGIGECAGCLQHYDRSHQFSPRFTATTALSAHGVVGPPRSVVFPRARSIRYERQVSKCIVFPIDLTKLSCRFPMPENVHRHPIHAYAIRRRQVWDKIDPAHLSTFGRFSQPLFTTLASTKVLK